MKEDRYESDITVYGATGSVGRHVLDYLLQSAYHCAGPRSTTTTPRTSRGDGWRITLAGRDADKLEALQQQLQSSYQVVFPATTTTEPHEDFEMVEKEGEETQCKTPKKDKQRGRAHLDIQCVAATDVDGLHALARRTRVVINVAGPMSTCGSDLVGACATVGTDYVDITGELEWAAAMRQRWSDAAAASGARLILSCGFSSVCSDLSVWTAVQELQHVVGAYARVQQASCLYSFKGGPPTSGGALETLRQLPLSLWRNVWAPGGPWFLNDPLILYPPPTAPKDDETQQLFTRARHQTTQSWARAEWRNQLIPQSHDCLHGAYSAPMPTAGLNAKVVYASALSLPYAAAVTQSGLAATSCADDEDEICLKSHAASFVYSERFLPWGFLGSIKFQFLSLLAVLSFQWWFTLTVLLLKMPLIGSILVQLMTLRHQAFVQQGRKAEYIACERGYVVVYAQVKSTLNDSAYDTANCCLKFWGDAGRWVTAQCVGEAALALLLDKAKLPTSTHGFGTPAQVLGRPLLERLIKSPVRPVECCIHVRNSTQIDDATSFAKIYLNKCRKHSIAYVPSFCTK